MFELLYKDALKNFLLEDLGVEGDVTSKHLGLAGMAERAALAGGDLTVSSQPGAGTIIALEVPVD